MLKLAIETRNRIYADFPGIRYYTELVTVDQQYYQLILEEKISTELGIDIFLCKDMWCARMLLRKSFKPGYRGIAKQRKPRKKETQKRKKKQIKNKSKTPDTYIKTKL